MVPVFVFPLFDLVCFLGVTDPLTMVIDHVMGVPFPANSARHFVMALLRQAVRSVAQAFSRGGGRDRIWRFPHIFRGTFIGKQTRLCRFFGSKNSPICPIFCQFCTWKNLSDLKGMETRKGPKLPFFVWCGQVSAVRASAPGVKIRITFGKWLVGLDIQKRWGLKPQKSHHHYTEIVFFWGEVFKTNKTRKRYLQMKSLPCRNDTNYN